jgi:hypothetical protein
MNALRSRIWDCHTHDANTTILWWSLEKEVLAILKHTITSCYCCVPSNQATTPELSLLPWVAQPSPVRPWYMRAALI